MRRVKAIEDDLNVVIVLVAKGRGVDYLTIILRRSDKIDPGSLKMFIMNPFQSRLLRDRPLCFLFSLIHGPRPCLCPCQAVKQCHYSPTGALLDHCVPGLMECSPAFKFHTQVPGVAVHSLDMVSVMRIPWHSTLQK